MFTFSTVLSVKIFKTKLKKSSLDKVLSKNKKENWEGLPWLRSG